MDANSQKAAQSGASLLESAQSLLPAQRGQIKFRRGRLANQIVAGRYAQRLKKNKKRLFGVAHFDKLCNTRYVADYEASGLTSKLSNQSTSNSIKPPRPA